MIEATIQFDFHLWSSNFHLPKTLTLQMKLSKYITLISRAFCTTKKKIIQKVKKNRRKIQSLLLILLNMATSKIQGSRSNDICVLCSFQSILPKVILLQYYDGL